MNQLDQLPIPLLQWYRENARVLPWRSDPTPYHVWVSEIMLQQTRVAAVLDYYRRFMEALPTVADLAAVEEDRLMKLWQGLGYYNRARNLQKAAHQVTEDFGGAFPDTYEGLLTLSGVGEYTAGAIASIAFGVPVPAVDGNVLRVVARISGDGGDIARPDTKARMRAALQAVLPLDAPGDFNQALMELGATVCLPNGAPRCDACPLQEQCLARRRGTIDRYPHKAPKKARRTEERTIFLLVQDGLVAVQKRPAAGLLRGLWELPGAEGFLDEAAARAHLTRLGLSPVGPLRDAGGAKHSFTHVEWRMRGWAAPVRGEAPGLVFAAPERIFDELCLPSAFRAYTGQIETFVKEFTDADS